MGLDKRKTQPGYYLTGQVVAAYIKVRLTPQALGRLVYGHFWAAFEMEFYRQRIEHERFFNH